MEEINKRLKNIKLWLDNMSDKNRETYSLLIKADIESIKEQLLMHSVGNHVFCPHCGDKRQLKVETDLNSGRVCKSALCKGK